MLDVPFFLFFRACFAYKTVFLSCFTLFLLSSSVSFANFSSIHEYTSEFFADLRAIDEESSLEESIEVL